MTPRENTSHERLYFISILSSLFKFIIYGATYPGVPHLM